MPMQHSQPSAGPHAPAMGPAASESVMWAAAAEASERVRRAVSMATGALAQHGIACTLVEGSAISAELSASDELVRRFATRASLAIAPNDIAAAERALVSCGWEKADPQGDMPMLRTALRHGRHLVFAMIDAPAPDDRLHPAHPEAVRLRNQRLSRWRVAVRSTLARSSSCEDSVGRLVTESIEVGLVEHDYALREPAGQDHGDPGHAARNAHERGTVG